jgi:outer membrane lipase/esterase
LKHTLTIATALSTLLLAGTAFAQGTPRAVVIGDSLSDPGNIWQATGGAGIPYPPQLGLRRFTNQLVWSEYLFGSTGNFFSMAGPNAGNVNYAFGGARTDALVANPPGTGTQLATYFARGGRFGSNDIATIWAGANNIFQGLQVAQRNPLTATQVMGGVATASAGDVGAQVRSLAVAGAPTIAVLNLPSFALLPQFNLASLGGSAQAAQLAGVSSAIFNAALASQLAGVAAANPQANIVQVNIEGLFDAAIANPGAFGFSNVSGACVFTPSCVAGGAAAQDQFLFWDGVHPTGAAHRLVSAAVAEYLTAPSRAAAISTLMGETTFTARRNATTTALADLGTIRPGTGKWEFFLNAVGDFSDRDGQTINGVFGTALGGRTTKSELATGGLRLGGLRDLGQGWTAGFSASVLGGELEMKSARASSNYLSFSLDALARWQSGGAFVNLALGGTVDKFSSYEYRTSLGNLTNKADPTATAFSATAEGGYDVAVSDMLTLTPVARLGYVHSELGSFAESGIIAPVAFEGRSTSGLVGAVELRLGARLTEAFKAQLMVGYEDVLAGEGGDVRGRLVNNTARPFAIRTRDPLGAGFLFGLGVEGKVGGNWSVRASYRGSVGDKDNVRHSGQIGVGTSF